VGDPDPGVLGLLRRIVFVLSVTPHTITPVTLPQADMAVHPATLRPRRA
jgi:hypothetical protein